MELILNTIKSKKLINCVIEHKNGQRNLEFHFAKPIYESSRSGSVTQTAFELNTIYVTFLN